MRHVKNEQSYHLSEISRMIAMYKVLRREQLRRVFSELDDGKLEAVLRRLEKSGRLVYDKERNVLCKTRDSTLNLATIAAVWVLLDFITSVTYHTASEYPMELSFFTATDSYDVIYVPVEKEIIMAHALAKQKDTESHRLVIVEKREQIGMLDFPGIVAYCLVSQDGQVQYFKKQGVVDS